MGSFVENIVILCQHKDSQAATDKTTPYLDVFIKKLAEQLEEKGEEMISTRVICK